MKQHVVCIKSNVVTLNKLHNIEKLYKTNICFITMSHSDFKHVQHVWVILYSHI